MSYGYTGTTARWDNQLPRSVAGRARPSARRLQVRLRVRDAHARLGGDKRAGRDAALRNTERAGVHEHQEAHVGDSAGPAAPHQAVLQGGRHRHL